MPALRRQDLRRIGRPGEGLEPQDGRRRERERRRFAENGADAKELIADGQVMVNNEVETRRGRKLYKGDIFSFDGNEVKVD